MPRPRVVIDLIDATWQNPWAYLLTAEQRRQILDDGGPRILFRFGERRIDAGQVLSLTSRVALRFDESPKRNKQGWILYRYTIIDYRDRVLRFRPPTRGKQVPAEELSASEIEKASEQSAYDGNPRDPMDAGICVPSEVQNVLSMQAHAKWADHRQQESGEAEAISQAKQLSKQIRDMALGIARAGGDPVPFLANIQREVTAERSRRRAA